MGVPPAQGPAARPRHATIVLERGGRIEWCDENTTRLLGYREGELIGRPAGEIVPALAADRCACYAGEHAGEAGCRHLAEFETHAVTRAGESRPVIVHVSEPPLAERPLRVVTIRDVSVESAREAELTMLATAVRYTADAVVITDRSGFIQYVNPAFEAATGYESREVLGKTPRILKSGQHPPEFYASIWNTIRTGKVFRATFANRCKDGRVIYEEKTISPIWDRDGQITHYVSTAKDVTQRKLADERLYALANYDSLTGLPNRNLFKDSLTRVLARAARRKSGVALLYLDVDRFKSINDTLGHAAGDELLRIVATRLKSCLRDSDVVTRLGGDEFAMILADLGARTDIDPVLERVFASFREPMRIQDCTITVSTSVGVSFFPEDGPDSDTLLKHADIAMYQAKKEGRNSFRVFQAAMRERQHESLMLEQRLRAALGGEEFVLHYQPQIELGGGRVRGVEALLRWQSAELGQVQPAAFIPLLEEMGMIAEVGRWVLRMACRDIRRLNDLSPAPLNIAVNISGQQFRDPGLIAYVEEILAETGIPPQAVECEITESVLMENVPSTMETLTRLSDMGVRIAIDDFGTGYSSLSYLRRFNIHVLKIDRSFIADIPHDEDATVLVRTIISMAKSLGIEVVAEGVELRAQKEWLREMRCDAIQGYLEGRPMTMDELARFLLEERRPGGEDSGIGGR